MLTPGVGLSLPELIQEQRRQIRQQALLWREVAAETRGDSHRLRRQAQHVMMVSRELAQCAIALLSVLQ